MKLTGNTVFIAGATSGIGLGLALSLHAAGNRVIVSGRREERLAQIVAENPGIESVLLDTTDRVPSGTSRRSWCGATPTSTSWSRWPASCCRRTSTAATS
ncbi:SDR family NAD(P)-dependent oxidoreductase [Streptomyces sp. NPDC059398]|uniref:SDR family NAD(P)-dependent oxidoreductase n=1 Tax=Streptomyces sp. NPDC059398 TaxID=3346820 RepID=UPI0036908BC5